MHQRFWGGSIWQIERSRDLCLAGLVESNLHGKLICNIFAERIPFHYDYAVLNRENLAASSDLGCAQALLVKLLHILRADVS